MVVALVFLEMMVSSSWVTLTFLLKINKRSKWETLSQSSLPESQSLSLLSSAWCSSCSWKSAYLKIVVSFPQQAPAEPWVYKLGIYWLLHGWQTLSKAHAIFMGSCWPFPATWSIAALLKGLALELATNNFKVPMGTIFDFVSPTTISSSFVPTTGKFPCSSAD